MLPSHLGPSPRGAGEPERTPRMLLSHLGPSPRGAGSCGRPAANLARGAPGSGRAPRPGSSPSRFGPHDRRRRRILPRRNLAARAHQDAGAFVPIPRGARRGRRQSAKRGGRMMRVSPQNAPAAGAAEPRQPVEAGTRLPRLFSGVQPPHGRPCYAVRQEIVQPRPGVHVAKRTARARRRPPRMQRQEIRRIRFQPFNVFRRQPASAVA